MFQPWEGAEQADWLRWAGLGETRSNLCRGRELDGETGAQGEGCAPRVERVGMKVEPGQGRLCRAGGGSSEDI